MTADNSFLCIDRIPPLQFSSLTDDAARETRADNAGRPAEGAGVRRCFWLTGMSLRVRFLDGGPELIRRVMEAASSWTEHANLDLRLVDRGAAEIRVTFQGNGNWSALGTDGLVPEMFPADGPTMCLSEVPVAGSSDRVLRVVRHEFGHAIGLVHEHSSPAARIPWNEEVVYAELAKAPNRWARADVDVNVLRRYEQEGASNTAFDERSVMLYTFPASWTTDRRHYDMNHELSPTDISFVRSIYPGR